MVQNPTLSIIQKLITNTIFARYDTSQVRVEELSLLFQGLKHIMRDEDGYLLQEDFGNDVNLGFIFAKELASYRNEVKDTAYPDLYIGGVLKPLFGKAKVPLDLLHYETQMEYIGYAYFIKCKMIKDTLEEGKVIYTFRGPNKRRCIFNCLM